MKTAKAQKLEDLKKMKKVISKNSPFLDNINKTIEKVLAEKEVTRYESVMKEIDSTYRIELQKEYKISYIFAGLEFTRRCTSRAALLKLVKTLTADINLSVTVTSRSIYVA